MFVALHDATNAGVHRKFTISLAKIYIYCKIKTNLLLYCIIPFYIIFFLCQAHVTAAAQPSGFKQIQTAAPGKEQLCFPGAAFRLAVTLLAFYSAEQLTGV